VLDPSLRTQLDSASLAEAQERGRARTAAEALAVYGVVSPRAHGAGTEAGESVHAG
jgi:hypothetical protein